ncbi:MAG: MEKHLA domain-containing protein [Candidatus Aenigmarchaeota archaeon]|nr:MEKHLA domain-containing protein [Candidatus Aenigmarchaeota archaeon]
MKSEIKKEIIKVIVGYGSDGATSLEIGNKVGFKRHTISKYLSIMEREGLLRHKKLGRGKIWFVNKNLLQKLSSSKIDDMSFIEKLIFNIASKIPIGLIVIDREYNIQFINDFMFKKYDNITGKKFYTSVLGLKKPNSLKQINKLIKSKNDNVEFEIIDKFDDTLRIKGTKVINPDNSISFILIIDDITKRKNAEKRFRIFFENEPAYCYMISPEGLIIDVNKSALKILEYKKENLVGKPLKKIYAPESMQKMKLFFKKWKKYGKINNEEMTIISKSGKKRTVILSANSVKNKNGKILHSISVQKDITERKKIEEKLKKTIKKLREN